MSYRQFVDTYVNIMSLILRWFSGTGHTFTSQRKWQSCNSSIGCKVLGVEAGDEIILERNDDGFCLTARQHRIQRAQQRAKKYLTLNASL